MEKAAGEDETVEARETAAAPIAGAPAAKKRKEGSGAMVGPPGAGICDDVLRNIFARLPARDAVACMAPSKHHCNLICSTEFRSLHCRLGAPLPRPHIAYIVTVPVRRRPEQEDAVGQFYGFHVAGAGLRDHAPVRAIAGSRYLGKKYINNCNGIVLLADEEFSVTCSCILWNPAIADAAKELESASVCRTCALNTGYYTDLLVNDVEESHDLRSAPPNSIRQVRLATAASDNISVLIGLLATGMPGLEAVISAPGQTVTRVRKSFVDN
ncbi:hypothetical protein EJB05_39504 [Eragrostis curvula]|uniref:F-box domain-containing protein n=1 Tax=Eragrostis curvula TaxID=38414 RepID=A0A5J9TX45_9POAL|nr:hypothetical protein EJB05_39504 [Eragrostis curvula]